ncbi:ThuA domain-containing protein [Streptomyces sp. NPDC054784]
MQRTARLAVIAAALLLGSTALPAGHAAQRGAAEGENVLVFSKTAGFRHDSIPDGIETVRQLGEENGFTVDATEDAAQFTPENLARYDAVVWLSTTGDVLDDAQQAAFEEYVRGGGGYAGVHAAADTEYDWPWYGQLAGTWFDSHPAIQEATVRVEDHDHPATAHLQDEWVRTDELYNYRANPRARTHVLATLDESTYDGGNMGEDHPITWCHAFDGGRSFYTGLGHTKESYAEPDFRQHLLGGIRYATGAADADCSPPDGAEEPGYTPIFDGTSLDGWKQAGPGSFELNGDGTMTTTGGMGLLWYEAEEYPAYSLKLDWKMAGDDNSGVFVGFPASDDPWTAVDNGYEVQIDATDAEDRTTGAVYTFQSADIAARDAALNPPGEWNAYELVVEGERLRIYLNDVLINDFTNTDPARSLTDGYFGLQNHGADDEVSFRNVRVKELTPPVR